MEKLYHFTCDHCIGGVLGDGLTKGSVVHASPGQLMTRLIPGFQWLTTERAFARQPWARQVMLKCDRTEWRIEIAVDVRRTLTWAQIVDRFAPWDSELLHNLEIVGGCESWRIFDGPIPASLLGRAERKPRLLVSA